MTVEFKPPFSTAIGFKSIDLDIKRRVNSIEELLEAVYRKEPNIELKLIKFGLLKEITESNIIVDGDYTADTAKIAENSKIIIYNPLFSK